MKMCLISLLFLVVGLVVHWLFSIGIREMKSMERLPDLLVLDFCEWLKQSVLRKAKHTDVDMWDLLFDDRYADILAKKAEEYCQRKKRQSEDWTNASVKDRLAEALSMFYKSDEFYEMCYKIRCYGERSANKFIFDEFQESFERFRRSQSGTLYDVRLYYCRQYLHPADLINSLKFCFADGMQKGRNGNMDTHSLLHLMIEDEPVEIDFLEWIEEQNIGKDVVEKVDLMPVEVFEEYAQRFCEDTGRGIATRQKLVNRFKRSEPGSMLSKLNELLPYNSAYRKKNFRHVSQRYLEDSDTYKCLLLPIKADYPMFRRLVTEHWKDLNDLSADYLDIYYCFENYGASGYDMVKQLHYLPDKVHAKLPCIILWKENMDEGLCIPIDGLSVEDVYYLVREVVDLIIQGKTLNEIVEGANDMGNEKRNKDRPIMNYNLSADGATNVNQAVVTGDGNVVSQSTSKNEIDNFVKELNQAIDIVAKSELSEEQKKILMDIFEDAKKKDKQEEAKARFSTFIAFAGKTAAKLIDVFAGLATIAAFFGLNQVH